MVLGLLLRVLQSLTQHSRASDCWSGIKLMEIFQPLDDLKQAHLT